MKQLIKNYADFVNEELSAGQKKLPPGLQKSILAKQGKAGEKTEEVKEEAEEKTEEPKPEKEEKVEEEASTAKPIEQ